MLLYTSIIKITYLVNMRMRTRTRTRTRMRTRTLGQPHAGTLLFFSDRRMDGWMGGMGCARSLLSLLLFLVGCNVTLSSTQVLQIIPTGPITPARAQPDKHSPPAGHIELYYHRAILTLFLSFPVLRAHMARAHGGGRGGRGPRNPIRPCLCLALPCLALLTIQQVK